MRLFPDSFVKIAKSLQLKKLIEAKRMSDKNNYSKKNSILADLLEKYPKEFKVDSALNNKYVGLTHKPSGFKIHAPRTLIPIGIEQKIAAMKKKKERVRVILPYKGSYLLEKLNNPAWPDNVGKRRHVGGGIETGEMPSQAAAREMKEELGIHVDPSEFKHVGKHENQHYLLLKNHGLHPGDFKATVGSDPIITLVHGKPEGADYMGPDIIQFLK
jgi:hypothetical protein